MIIIVVMGKVILQQGGQVVLWGVVGERVLVEHFDFSLERSMFLLFEVWICLFCLIWIWLYDWLANSLIIDQNFVFMKLYSSFMISL